MSVTVSFPGVYITEIPSGNRTITGVATSITAFVGAAPRGTLDRPVSISSWADFERAFGGLWALSALGYAVEDFFANGGSQALVVRVVRTTDPIPENNAAPATLSAGNLSLRAASPGDWANGLVVDVIYPSAADAAEVALAQGVPAEDLFNLVIRESAAADAYTETYHNLTMRTGPRPVNLALANSALVEVVGIPPAARPPVGQSVVPQAGRGRNGVTPGITEYRGDAGGKTGIYALLRADLFNILCIPPPTLETDLPTALWLDAATLCFEHQAFLIMDPPRGSTTDSIPGWLAGLGIGGLARRNAALYFPRIRRADRLRQGAIRDEMTASGAIAGTFARIDSVRGV